MNRLVIGQRVEGTEAFRRSFPRTPAAGVVVGRCRKPGSVRLRLDGHTSTSSWGEGWWVPVGPPHSEYAAELAAWEGMLR